MKQKWCLVLGGGGAKGAYQVGAWKALREYGFEFEAVVGTSVGSLNGALVGMDFFDTALELWENISMDQVLNLPGEMMTNGNLDLSKLNLKTLKQLQKEIVKTHGFDTTPLRNKMNRILDEEKLRKSGIDFGLVTFDAFSFKPVEIFIDRIPSGKLCDYLMASSSIPGFKFVMVKNKLYLDGGLYDNIPFNLAKYRGYRHMVVIDVAGIGVNKKPDLPLTTLIYIKPSQEFGNILDFSQETTRKNIQLGYLDTLRTVGGYEGIQYCYQQDHKIIQQLSEILFSEKCWLYYSEYFDKKEKVFSQAVIDETIRNYLPERFRENREIIIPLLEACALILGIDTLRIYTIKELVQAVFDSFQKIRERKRAVSVTEVLGMMKPDNIMDLLDDFKRYQVIDDFIFSKEFLQFSGAVKKILPMLVPLKIFYILLEIYFEHQ